MPTVTYRQSLRPFAWGIFKRSWWTLTTLVFDPYDIISRGVNYLAPGRMPVWEVPIMMFWISVALFVLMMAFFTYHELHKDSQAEIDRLTPPPEHPRVTDAKAELLTMAQEGARLASDPALTTEAGQKWDLDATTLVANITDLADSKAFRNFMYQARRQQEPIDTVRGCLLRGSSWLMRKADCLRYDELTPAFTHPAPKGTLP
jgi:hypothetical protein